ncbi:MAG: nucleotidyltransferase family protein [Oscillospiraceae bacterium]|nr:nucleotidyltransferase family protein [Oscillospiraceae bacterium]
MKTAGIIAEYNPFHNGHMRQIQATREAGYGRIIAVMSGNVVQRGDVAVCDMGFRARTAVKNGVDLVLELPMPYSLSSAEDFARAGVSILSRLGCVDALSFGSECGDVGRLQACADAIDGLNPAEIKALMSDGLTYPQATAKLLGDDILSGANNVLAIEYIRKLKNTGIEPFTVQRNISHDSSEIADTVSAMKLREMLRNSEDVSKFVPEVPEDLAFIENIDKLILSLAAFQDSDNPRIRKYAMQASSLNELYSLVKTKNITHARVRREVLQAALGIRPGETATEPPYARILAANEKGIELLGEIKKKGSIPVSTSLAELSKISSLAARNAELTERASKLWHFAEAEQGSYRSEFSREFSVSP